MWATQTMPRCHSYAHPGAQGSPPSTAGQWLKLTLTEIHVCSLWRPYSATWLICWVQVGAVTVLSLPDVAWPGECAGNSSPTSPDTYRLRCMARCTWTVSYLLCSKVAKRGNRMQPACSHSTAMTAPWSTGFVAPKTMMNLPRLHFSRNLVLR